MEQKYYIKHLDCAHCASEIETNLKRCEGIRNVRLDFVQKTLKIETDQSTEEVLAMVNREARKIEPEVEICLQKQPEETDRRRLILFLTGAFLFAVAFFLSHSWQLPAFVCSFLLVGYPVLFKSLKNIMQGRIFDENFLMSVASCGAFLIGESAEGVAVMMFYMVGEFFQELAVDRSRKSIAALMDIKPDSANLVTSYGEQKVDPQTVHIGDVILVKPGEKIPVDGIVLEGTSALDKRALTGESIPETVDVGCTVLSGSVNLSGLIKIEVTAEFEDSTVSKILNLVEHASENKAKTEHFITKFARIYTPLVMLGAVAISLIPPLFRGFSDFGFWLYRGLTFLVISCPCALVISVPLGFFGGIGRASRNGILMKGSNYLEGFHEVDTLVFDKTGTLTQGSFEVTDVLPEEGFSEQEVLKYAAYCESFSNHPIARSVCKAYGEKVTEEEIFSYEEIAGHGVCVTWKGKQLLAGNWKWMEKQQIAFSDQTPVQTVVYVAVDGRAAGRVLMEDRVKPGTKETIEKLRKWGIRNIVMLTGDSRQAAETVGQKIGIQEIVSDLLPQHKVEVLAQMMQKKSGGKIAFIGDGINDAPVLKMADIGIAMGGIGSDAAIEASDIVLMTDEISKLVTAKKIATETRQIVVQNIVFALSVKFLILLLTAFGIGNMWGAVFADVGVALLAVLNALRSLKKE